MRKCSPRCSRNNWQAETVMVLQRLWPSLCQSSNFPGRNFTLGSVAKVRRISLSGYHSPSRLRIIGHSLCYSGHQCRVFNRTSLVSTRLFHTSTPRPAPQFLLVLFGPLSRFLVAIGGRLTRSWWSRLSPERRAAIRASIGKNSKYFYGFFGVITLSGVGYYTSHSEQTPITRRRRFIMFPREQVLKMIESEKKNILRALCNADEHNLLSHNTPTYQQVHRIVSRILAKNNIPEFEGFDWALYVIDRPDTVNALCLPTGDIFVYSGLVNQCRNDEELAFILSHEIAHAVLGHGVEALSRNGVLNFVQLFLIAVIWTVVPSDLLSYFMHSFSRSTVKVLLEYPHSRKLETEADKVVCVCVCVCVCRCCVCVMISSAVIKVGLLIASRACYDPEQAVCVWQHLQNINSGKELEFLSTHPANETRLEPVHTHTHARTHTHTLHTLHTHTLHTHTHTHTHYI